MAPVLIFLLPSKNPQPGIPILTRIKGIDWIGAALVTSCLCFFTLALSFGGNQFAWNSAVVISFFVVSGVLAILFGLSQTIMPGITKENRLFPAHYFLRKDMVLLSVTTAAGSGAMFCAIYYIPLFFQFTRGDSAIKAAVRLLPLICMSVFWTVAGGGLLSAIGLYTPFYLIGGILILVGYCLLHTISPTTSDSAIYGFLVLIGSGTGMCVQLGFAVAQAISPKFESEAAISFVMQGQLLGLIITLAIAGSVFITDAIKGLTAIFPNVSSADIKGAIAGTNAEFLKTLPLEVQNEALAAIVRSMDTVFILGITAGAVVVLCGLLLTQKRIDMKAINAAAT
jgi:hypothetical protein